MLQLVSVDLFSMISNVDAIAKALRERQDNPLDISVTQTERMASDVSSKLFYMHAGFTVGRCCSVIADDSGKTRNIQ